MGAILEHSIKIQMEKHNFVTIADLSKEKIMYLLEMAQEFEKHPNRELLKGKVVATLFFEPSTRTQLSFQTAANRLGARVIGFSDAKTSSTTKGETLKDTILMVSNYADVIAMRHFIEGAAQYASEVAPVPIVNAGDGAHMHPSQCLLVVHPLDGRVSCGSPIKWHKLNNYFKQAPIPRCLAAQCAWPLPRA